MQLPLDQEIDGRLELPSFAVLSIYFISLSLPRRRPFSHSSRPERIIRAGSEHTQWRFD